MGTVKPIPEGFHTVTPHLMFKDTAQAIEFYKKAFGAQELHRMPGPDGKGVMHAMIRIGDSFIMMADEWPGMGNPPPETLGKTTVTLNLYVENCDAVYNQAVAAGAKPTMPVADQFWGDRYGKLLDPFGHDWAIATHVKDMTPEEMGKAAQAAFAQMQAGKH